MSKTVTLDVGAYFEGLDHLGVVKQLLAEVGVQAATSNPASGSVTVRYDEAVTNVAKLRKVIVACGQHCRGEATPHHVCVPEDMPGMAMPDAAKSGSVGGADRAGDHAGHDMTKSASARVSGSLI